MINLNNNDIELIVYPPSPQDPHFATRYNHAGYIANIYLKKIGRYLLERPMDEFKPFDGDGFPDEFETPLGYDNAMVGESFVKVGVGEEKKLSQVPYTNWDCHPITKLADTYYELKGNSVTFGQTLRTDNYAYVYHKTISLIPNGFEITHDIKNVGGTDISTMWYSHCFISLEGQDKAELSLPVSFVERENCSNISSDSRTYTLSNTYSARGECFNWDVPNEAVNRYTLGLDDYTLSVECDKACYEFQLYINKRIISPEPKIDIVVKKGENFTFTSRYIYNVKE